MSSRSGYQSPSTPRSSTMSPPIPPPTRLSSHGSASASAANNNNSNSNSNSNNIKLMPTLPPPPVVSPSKSSSNYAENIAKSMTIDEMRQLHQRAQSEAEAKQTELRLVLASRYRELVGSSDEVTRMRERSQELHELVHALPNLMEKLIQSSSSSSSKQQQQQQSVSQETKEDPQFSHGQQQQQQQQQEPQSLLRASSDTTILDNLRRDLSLLPRVVHRALDTNNVHQATVALMTLFRLIAQHTDKYPLAKALAATSGVVVLTSTSSQHLDPSLQAQMHMSFLHTQTIPSKIIRISKSLIHASASYGRQDVMDPSLGAQTSAAALSALDLLDIKQQRDRPVQLLDLYFDSKAKLLQSLLNKLSSGSSAVGTPKQQQQQQQQQQLETAVGGAHNAEEILSKIVLILQYDIIMHPYQIFVLRKFPTTTTTKCQEIMKSLPIFPTDLVQSKSSNFLAAHLPLIRTKVKTVLVDIAGTTAAALGKIRQSLYDKTDGVECMQRLDNNGVCTWEQAVSVLVDVQSVINHGMGGGPSPATAAAFADGSTHDRDVIAGVATSSSLDHPPTRKFSLWSVLFSNTFSSLVHSLLTTSFHSVHTQIASTLRLSLANAPPLSALLPHEAYRNTLQIASELDRALLKVSDDAHELLVHAEERVESERRLRQSLYVQTCEIMGRLICELRRMLLTTRSSTNGSIATDATSVSEEASDAVKQLIVGRLCHLLKFRLTALPTLLHPSSSPAALHGSSGMISLVELSSAFSLADDNDDGLITFAEAIEAVDSAFSGTQFHGGEMVRETLLLPSAGGEKDTAMSSSTTAAAAGGASSNAAVTPHDVTLNELTLLSARGLRHEASGSHSALGTIQDSLDAMIGICLRKWAKAALSKATNTLHESVDEFVGLASTVTEMEYQRMYVANNDAMSQQQQHATPAIATVSPHIIGYILEVSSVLSRSICPSDSLVPVPSLEYASAMGIEVTNEADIPRMIEMIRWALLRHSLDSVTSILDGSATETAVAALGLPPRIGGNTALYSLSNIGPSGLIQIKSDIVFVQSCFFQRNRHGFGTRNDDSTGTTAADASKTKLEALAAKADALVQQKTSVAATTLLSQLQEKHDFVFESCDLFLTALLGDDTSAVTSSLSLGKGDFTGGGVSKVANNNPLLYTPLASSCRFPLLPIQSDRTLSDVQLRGKYKDAEESSDRRQDAGSSGGGVMKSGLGFFTSILKKN